MDLVGPAGGPGDGGVYRYRRGSSDAAVELAAAAAVRLAADHLLARAGTSGAMPDSLRRTWTPRSRTPRFSWSHERAMPQHDSRGAGTVSASHAGTMELWQLSQPEHGAMKVTGVDLEAHERSEWVRFTHCPP
jgi:hypothetical protein